MRKKLLSLFLVPLTVLFSFAIVSIYRKTPADDVPLVPLRLMDTMGSYDYSYFNSAYNSERYYVNKFGNGISAEGIGFGNGEDMLGISGVNGYSGYLKSRVAEGETLPTVVIAVVDSGINLNHEIFRGRVMAEQGGGFYDGSGEREDDLYDHIGHGTHVAGLICDTTLPNVKILPIKIFNVNDELTNGNVIMPALEYVVSLKKGGMNIVAANMSLGTPPLAPTDAKCLAAPYNGNYKAYLDAHLAAYQGCIDVLTDVNILPIVSAGNGGSVYPSLPAACDGTVSVSAFDARDFENYDTDKDGEIDEDEVWFDIRDKNKNGVCDQWEEKFDADTVVLSPNNAQSIDLSDFSNYGGKNPQSTANTECLSSRVDIAAPGSEIFSASNNGRTSLKMMSGTSMATPYVAAAYALLYSDPEADRTAAEARAELINNAMPIGAAGTMAGNFGAGCVSLLSVTPEYGYPAVGLPYTPPSDSETAKVTVTVSGGGMVSYKEGNYSTPIGEYILADNTAGFSVRIYAAGGYHILKVTVGDEPVPSYSYTDGDAKKYDMSFDIAAASLNDLNITAEFSTVFAADDLRLQSTPAADGDDDGGGGWPLTLMQTMVAVLMIAGVVTVSVSLIKNRGRNTPEGEMERIMRELEERENGSN